MPKRKPQKCTTPKIKSELARSRSRSSALEHATSMIYQVCCLAGSASFLDDLRTEASGDLQSRMLDSNAAAFDWLIEAFSYQGVSDRAAAEYIERHGTVTWMELEQAFAKNPSCPRLQSYWHFKGCRYDKTSGTCAEPEHIHRCPLPKHKLRNGRLNQTAYSLFLFVRNLAQDDLLQWIDQQLATRQDGDREDRRTQMSEALIGPMRNIFGVADKVLTMTLSNMLLAASADRPLWHQVGADMITVDTLVHNFLHRTGIARRFDAEHAYGALCYRPNRCAAIIRAVATRIDARQFNRSFPASFPRFVQHAIWRYCAQDGLNICNGNRVNDRRRCQNSYCRLFGRCDKRQLLGQKQ